MIIFIIFGALIIYTPIKIYSLIKKHINNLEDKQFKQDYSELIEDISTRTFG